MRFSFAAPLKKHSHAVCRPFVLDVVVGLAPEKRCAIETGCCNDRPANISLVQYEETQETLALLKVLALANRQVEEGKLRPAADTLARIRKRLSDNKS